MRLAVIDDDEIRIARQDLRATPSREEGVAVRSRLERGQNGKDRN
jgi:hypothetical protein